MVALITGASSGIGAELAKLFARDKADLVLVARTAVALESLAAELRAAHGVSVHVVPLDLSNPSAPEILLEKVNELGLTIDTLVNNAGYATFGPFADSDTTAELNMLQLNVMALTHLSKLFLPGMIQRRTGRIMNVASTAAFQPGPLMACYYASKAYVLQFSEALHCEVQGTGVTVTTLCPGPTISGFQQRAGMEKSGMVSGMMKNFMMTSEAVAKAGYDAMRAGKPLIVTGLMNQIQTSSVRLMPRAAMPAIVKRLQRVIGH